MHAKLAVIDRNSAYTIGSGLIQEYFDGRQHLIEIRAAVTCWELG